MILNKRMNPFITALGTVMILIPSIAAECFLAMRILAYKFAELFSCQCFLLGHYLMLQVPCASRSISSTCLLAISAATRACLRLDIGPPSSFCCSPLAASMSFAILKSATFTSNQSRSASDLNIPCSVPVCRRDDGLWPYLRATRSRRSGVSPAKKLVPFQAVQIEGELRYLVS